MHHLQLLAGIAFNPGIRGILVVATGVGVLMGSVYLLLATNIGSRLGLMVAFTGLFGWLTILTLIWWITPPAIGPRGNNASWRPVEIYVNGADTPKTVQVGGLADPSSLPTADAILADHPELAADYPNGFLLSDLQANNPEILKEYIHKEDMNGWTLVASSAAGESQAAADVALVNARIFTGPTDYKKLNTWEYGGKPKREDECADSGLPCRLSRQDRPHAQAPDPLRGRAGSEGRHPGGQARRAAAPAQGRYQCAGLLRRARPRSRRRPAHPVPVLPHFGVAVHHLRLDPPQP